MVWLCTLDLFRPFEQALSAFLGPDVTKPWFTGSVIGLAIVVCAFAIAWVTIDVVRFSLKCVVVVPAFLLVLSLSLVLGMYQVLFPTFAPAVAILLSFLLGSLYSMSEMGGRKPILSHLFGNRISPRTFRALLNSDVPLNFEGSMMHASVLLCEIFNHDELMEGLSPVDYVALNNLFLGVSSEFLIESGGYIDECDGESLRVVFGAPLPDPEHAIQACKAGLELAKRLDLLNFECQMKWKKTFDYRIGINSGEMIGASYGSKQLAAFSLSGQPLEFARRLCEGNVGYGSTILIGAGTHSLASSAIEVRPLEIIRLRDERTLEEIYELIGLANGLSEKERLLRDHFWKGVIYYREHLLNEALASFRAAINPDRKDPPLEHYISRIENLLALEGNGNGKGA